MSATSNSIPQSQSPVLTAALDYAARGWPVLPLETPEPLAMAVSGRGMIRGTFCSCHRGRQGEECPSCGKHPRSHRVLLPNGKLSATTDAAVIERWWQEWPTANIGICAGAASGFLVIDIDPKNGGEESLAALEEQHGTLPDTLRATTGSGGRHYLFAHPGGILSGGANKLAPGVDVKADDGYIVAAPSLHKSGQRYAWDNAGTPIAPCPSWILEAIAAGGTAGTAKKTRLRKDAPLAGRLTEGQRNDTIFRELCGMRSRGLSDAAIRAAADGLNREMSSPPLPDAELATIVNSVINRYDPGTSNDTPPMTDLGNAERLQARHGDSIRWCEPAGGWFAYDGRRWTLDTAGLVRTRAYDTARAILLEAYKAPEGDQRDKLMKWARTSESRRGADNMLEQAKPLLPLPSDAWDRENWLLNCQNGTLNLCTGELRDHDRRQYLRKIVPAVYDPTATAPDWDAFLRTTFDGDEELISFVQRAAGYTLTGDVSMQCLFFCYGRGANGKSTFVETMGHLMGDYQAKFPNRLLIASRFDDGGAATPDVAALDGVRMAHANEIERDSRLAESRVKDLTGGDTITARFLHRNYFSFQPTHKLWIYGNDKPIIRGTDTGIWRRMLLIPFVHTISPEQKNPSLKELVLYRQLPGILNWMLRGCLDWQARGKRLDPPEAVLAATDSYRTEMDTFAEFLADCCITGGAYTARASTLYDVYQKWAIGNGIQRPMTGTAFGREMGRRGFEKKHTMVGSFYYGIGTIDN